MNRICWTTRIVVTTLVLLGLVRSAAAGPQVPFQGTITASEVSVITSFPLVTYNWKFSGQATHFGRCTGVFQATINVLTTARATSITLTAPNGDSISGIYNWDSAPSGKLNIVTVTTTFRITGGTGRFAGASGGGSGTGQFNTVTGMGTGVFNGTVSSPGANKKK